MIFRGLCRALAMPMVMVMFLVAGPLSTAPLSTAHAAMVSTGEVIGQEAAAENRARVTNFLARADVRQQMAALGVDPDEAAARAAALSDTEISRIAGKLDENAAGQGAVGTVVGAALVVFIVLLVTDILCLTSVFPFTRCAAR